MKKTSNEKVSLYTIGHGTKSLNEFIATLQAHGVRQLVDVRSIPRSRHNPQFNSETLGSLLRRRQVGYLHMRALGGLRRPLPDSPNMGWHSASFRGFADYMQTPAFEKAVEKLIALASNKPTAIMCAESVPWHCHRSLIADALTARGVRVFNVYSPKRVAMHTLMPMARVQGTRITYPPEEAVENEKRD